MRSNTNQKVIAPRSLRSDLTPGLPLFFILTGIEGILASLVLLSAGFVSASAHHPVLLAARVLTGTLMVGIAATCLWLGFKSRGDAHLRERLSGFFERLAVQPTVQILLAWAVVWLTIFILGFLLGALPAALSGFPGANPVLIQRSLPVWIWLDLALIQLAITIYSPSRALLYSLVKAALVSLGILMAMVLYLYGSLQQLEGANRKMSMADQGAYMEISQKMAESGFRYLGDRNRMPVYPLIQAVFYRPGMKPEDFFRQGKYLNLYLSVVILAVLAILFFWRFHPFHALSVILVIAFTVFLFKAGYFQAELLFYFFSFCLFALMWRFFEKPSILLGAAIGAMAGLAHLTKASIIPGLALFLLFAVVQAVRKLVQGQPAPPAEGSNQGRATPFFGLVAVVLVFLAVLYPYIQQSKRIFGQYFYNVNSTFYIWYDSWEDAKQGTRAHGDRLGWPDMPADQIPSLGKYLREHTPQQIVERVWAGSLDTLSRLAHSFGYFKYGMYYLIVFFVACSVYQRRAREGFRKNPYPWLFAIAYFCGYFLLYAWYSPIGNGARFALALLIPFLYTLSAGLQGLLGDQSWRVGGRPVNLLAAVNVPVLLALAVNIYFILTVSAGTLYGGN